MGGEGRSGRTHKVARNRYAQLGRTTGSGARSTTSSVRRRVVEFWVAAHANRWVLAAAATGRRQRPRLWVRTVPEGFVGRSEGCPTAPIVLPHLCGVARPACRTERSVCQILCTARTRCRKTIGAVGHPSDRATKPSCTARCLGERSRREHERLRDRSRRSVTAGRAKMWGAKIHAWKTARCSPLKPHGPLGTPGERPRIFSGMFDT